MVNILRGMVKMDVKEYLRSIGRNTLEEIEVKNILKEYNINVPKGIVVNNLDKIEGIEFPVAIKVSDPEILHKTDVGGVILNIRNEDELFDKFKEMKEKFPKSRFLIESMERPGLEMIIGIINDKNFGQTIMLGMGGIFTELYRDVTFRLIPIDRRDAYSMIEDLKASKVFEGFRNMKPNKDELVELLLKVSKLGMDLEGFIEQLDLNPVFVRENDTVVVDAKMILKFTP